MLAFDWGWNEFFEPPAEGRFAVVDGAQFDDLPASAAASGLSCYPLHLEFRSKSVSRNGPHIIPVENDERLKGLLALLSGRPAAVFWRCAGLAVLFRHLRTIGLVRVPRGSISPKAPNPNAEVTVLFRHSDPRVLKMVLPQLDAGQFARLLGPASEIFYVDEDVGQILCIAARADGPTPPPGPLRFNDAQMRAIVDSRVARSRRRIADCLTEIDPRIAEKTGVPIEDTVMEAEKSAHLLGIRTERGIGMWALLLAATGGKVKDMPEVRRLFDRDPGRADQIVSALAEQAAVHSSQAR